MLARVLMLVENLPVPYDRRVWNECRALAQAGFDVTVISPQGEGADAASYAEIEGVRIHRYPPRWSSGGARGYLVEYATALWRVLRIGVSLARREPFDVVHAANPPDVLFLAALPLRLYGARFVFDQHDLAPELVAMRTRSRALRLAARLFERASFGAADLVVSPNETYRRIALGRGRVPPERTVVVRNGPDLATWQPVEPDEALRRGKRYLLCYVGMMGPQDGLDYALRAIGRLRSAGRDDFHATFIGDGDARAGNAVLARELEDCVEFTGLLGDLEVRRYLSTADVCLAPEPKTPLNDASTMIKVMEYMAIGVPVVAFDLAETRVSAGDAAVYAKPNDEGEFARLVAELLDDSQRRERMADEGRRRVRESLSWEPSRAALVGAYERLFGR